MSKLKDKLKSAKRPERVVPLCLRGDLVAEIEELDRQLVESNARNRDSIKGNSEARDLAQRIEALQAEMQEHTLAFRLRGLNDPEWHALIAENPPRDGNRADDEWGYNTETFFPALVRACAVDVDGDVPDDEDWAEITEKLSSGQAEQLRNAAIAVSRTRVDVPKSPAASATLRKSDATSK